jgi:uncharacterized membrane protein
VIAVVLDLVTRSLDRAIARNQLGLPRLLDRGGAEDMRSVLATIAGASITTLGLVLSLTMVTLSIAATQLGPRLIRNFLATRARRSTATRRCSPTSAPPSRCWARSPRSCRCCGT